MKLLAFILSLYIFALNLAPCEDNAALDNEVKTEISQAIGDDHQHQDSDLCSPFCICQCCHINATHFKFVNIKFNTIYISTQDFFYLSGTEKDFTTSILQPPRA
ncbi:hypothetical protein L3X39_13240 [Sabulilitoribacter multivorans]|uniref:Uncharacterized protein n=1 Tax=Flaviramulus multivorans TaxID=1304750 RepID=A0ABS9ILZ8_9FLAO|nr:DUF6660 family protein [Flaviramulus multivorans]MCF7561605.1 hypothetical protein [Flaviramulus multivorans]